MKRKAAKNSDSPEREFEGVGKDPDNPVRVYCDGIYDLFHFGHARALEQAKKVSCVCNDEVTHNMKGKTVMTGAERAESLRHCKWVDEVVENAPWVVDGEFLDKHRIDYVAHDDIPYKSGDIEDVYAFVKRQGKFLPTKRTDGISTSDLITRIVRDYDQYVRRNLDRGVTAKELNVGFIKETELQMKKQVEILRGKLREGEEYIKQNWAESAEESKEYLKGFLALFGNDGPVQKFLKRSASPVIMMKRLREEQAPPPPTSSSSSSSSSGE